MKKLLFAGIAILAPLIATISCNKNTESLVKNSSNNEEDMGGSLVNNSSNNEEDIGGSLVNNSSNNEEDMVASIPQTASDLYKQIDKTPYSISSLHKEAVEINDNAMWRRAINYEALVQTISLVNSFAIYSGWDLEKDFLLTAGKQSDIDSLPSGKYINIKDDNTVTTKNASENDLQGDDKKIYDLFKTMSPLKVEDFNNNKNLADQSTMVFNYQDMAWSFDRVGVTMDRSLLDPNWQYLNNKSLTNSNGFSTRTISYSDYKNPGTNIVQSTNLHSPIAITKTIKVTSGVQTYPIIKPEKKAEFQPYIELAIFKLLQLLSDDGNWSTLSSAFVDLPTEQLSLFKFLVDKYIKITPTNTDLDLDGTNDVKKEIVIPKNILEDFWNEVNNGSHNMQSIKAMLLGFDNSFDNSVYDFLPGEKAGFLSGDFEVFSIPEWAAEPDKSKQVKKVLPNSGLDYKVNNFWVFWANKSIDENTKANTGFNTWAEYETAIGQP